jgi:hypothetical protein
MAQEISSSTPAAQPAPTSAPGPVASSPATVAPEIPGGSNQGGEAQQPQNSQPQHNAVQRRINRLVRENHELQRKLEAQSVPAPVTPATPTAPKEPKIEDFDDLDSYIAAKAKHVADEQIKTVLTQHSQEQQTKAAQAEFAKVQKAWQENVAEYSADHPDFAEAVEFAETPITTEVGKIIMESEHGPAVLHHLAVNPEVARKIMDMSATAAARAIGKIEAAIEAKGTTPHKSSAPKPIAPVSGSGSTSSGPDDSQDINTWVANERKRREAKMASVRR